MPASNRRLILRSPKSKDDIEFIRRQILAVAEEEARATGRLEEGREQAQLQLGSLVDPELRGRGHRFFVGVDDPGRRVGWVWIGPLPDAALAVAADAGVDLTQVQWLYQITVDASLRRRGHGRGLLRVLEEVMVREGVRELYLRVLYRNEAARALYRSAGYEIAMDFTEDAWMRKKLAHGSPRRDDLRDGARRS